MKDVQDIKINKAICGIGRRIHLPMVIEIQIYKKKITMKSILANNTTFDEKNI